MNETLNDEIKSFKDNLLSRLKGVVTPYIITSWLLFNWSNILYVLMSKTSIENRILAITNQEYLYLKYLIAPIVVGIILSALTPYINFYVMKVTAKSIVNMSSIYQMTKLSNDTSLANKEADLKEATARIPEIERRERELFELTKILEERKTSLSYEIYDQYEQIHILILRTDRIIDDLRIINMDTTPELVDSFRFRLIENINSIFTKEERTKAEKWREGIKKNEGDNHLNLLLNSELSTLNFNEETIVELAKLHNESKK